MPLNLTDETPPQGFERLVRIEDPESGLRALICIHSTVLGPAAGGCRMWDYAGWDEARRDVQRLAEGMTYKNAMADLGLGGGKSVILGDARRDKTPQMFRAFGRAVNALEGAYYTAEDVGISPEDMAQVATETAYAVGLEGGQYGSGDPSPFTAEGVFQCLRVGVMHVFGSDDLTGRQVLIQGLGHVGMSLAEKLHAAGASLIVTDIDKAALARAERDLGARVIAPDQVFATQMDIFAPCALGAILDETTVPQLTAKLVCGAANNQLAQPGIAEELRARGIRYLPDYVVNAGGIISVAGEIHKAGPGYRRDRLSGIAARVDSMLARADKEGRTTTAIASDMVKEILASAERSV
ncbi:Leu/Phe/Val dehydrogenase [Paracoccus marinaquae]|uniref:Amino acid dehydrogenase n=1 Tax=Paracoccus marinaquae TaxID=2841926 RepID=A0ABS6AHM3_9RHOB|nr:Glu/Leu/Phe/Val dehydrogenase dimerization domain-containing protein [Paracoccus marinaquae]MBU3030033.1 amino acid dehydrogenase [Paracoccus marinaquae]